MRFKRLFIIVVLSLLAISLWIGPHIVEYINDFRMYRYNLRMECEIEKANVYKAKQGVLRTRSCKVAGEKIAVCLNEYYRYIQEYPSFLLGDHRTPLTGKSRIERGSHADWHSIIMKGKYPIWHAEPEIRKYDSGDYYKDEWYHIIPDLSTRLSDPLIDANCIVGFPVYERKIEIVDDSAKSLMLIEVELGWRCIVSTPGCEEYISNYAGKQLSEISGRELWLAGSKKLRRYVTKVSNDNREKASGIRGPVFGYQNGALLGMDSSSAWLWMYDPETVSLRAYEEEIGRPYSHNPTRITLKGLDLISTTGEIIPDGIPDGICILYKLKDGEVVEVIHADDIECE